MDKLPLLKQTLISAFSDVIRRAQKGYPLEGYTDIRQAMFAINIIENFTVESDKATTIIDHYLRKFNNL